MYKNSIFLVMLIAALLLSACSILQPAAEESTSDVDFVATSVAETVQAIAMQQPTMTEPAPVIEPTLTLPAMQPTNTVGTTVEQPTIAPAKTCLEAEFISETIPDGTKFGLNEYFNKTWTFKNTGTCTWTTDYKMVFTSGDIMGAPAAVSLTETVLPEGQITVSVPMQASYLEGTYTGYWALQDEYGTNFFTNNSVKIGVVTDAFRVTGVTTDLIDREPSCPYDYYYDISITASSAGTVKYQLSDKAGNSYSMKSLVFTEAGTQKVDASWMNIGSSGSYWVKVYIKVPNNQTFGPFKFDIDCD